MSIIARRTLAAELRRIRDHRNLIQATVSADMEWSLSKLIRIEQGSVGISTSDLRALLAYYGVGDDRLGVLLPLARRGRERGGWWHQYRKLVPQHLLDLAAFEEDAERIAVFEPTGVPHLLQTGDYALAIDSEYAWFQQLRRSAVLNRAPELVFAIDMSVLYRHPDTGGQILPWQLKSIIEDARRPNVTVRVMPYDAGVHCGWGGGFSVYDTSGTAASRFNELLALCLDADASVDMLQTAFKAL